MNENCSITLHLIGNAHIDPVWLWDSREGLNEGLSTVRTILDLMDEDPEMTFIRGEAAIYEHIEANDPATFDRILRQVENSRWDVVGGTYIQPDSNLAAVETLARHFTRGQRYFISRFGRPVRAAWQADSFGHSIGWAEVLAAAGIESFAFTRPVQKDFFLEQSSFWWEASSGARILCYRPANAAYCIERDGAKHQLDLAYAQATKEGVRHAAAFYGLGNHGGGPSRRHLADIREWRKAHPEVRVIHSGLHRFFETLRAEMALASAKPTPLIRGELNFCLRGCYASVARFKFPYRRAERQIVRAEVASSLIGALGEKSPGDLSTAWDELLFNSFHDILPGTSIERAMDEQIAAIGGVLRTSRKVEFESLNRLAGRIDTRVGVPDGDFPQGVALLAWNPLPFAYDGHLELEAALDYRPIYSYSHRCAELPVQILGPDRLPLPFQKLETEHAFMTDHPWRYRALVPVRLPAFGWNILEMSWKEGTAPPRAQDESAVRSGPGSIENGFYRVEAQIGQRAVRILHEGKSIFPSGDGLGAALFEDPWGSWGGMSEEEDSYKLREKRETFTIAQVETLESGPERAMLWIRLAGQRSRLDLSISLTRDRDAVDARARVFLDERSARLKLIMPAEGRAEFAVSGGSINRDAHGEVPGGQWVHLQDSNGGFGFASDALSSFSVMDGEFGATIVRATRYASDLKLSASEKPWYPAVDIGELKFSFLLTSSPIKLSRLASELEQPPLVLAVASHDGPLRRAGALAALSPGNLVLLTLKPAEGGAGYVLRLQAPASTTAVISAQLKWLSTDIDLGEIRSGEIASWRLQKIGTAWKARRVDLSESEI